MSEVARNAPGQPRPRRAGRRAWRRDGRHVRPAALGHRPSRGRRQAVLPDPSGGRQPARRAAAGQGRQPDPRRGAGPARAAPGREVVLVSRTSTCASRRVRSFCRRRTISTTRRWTTATCYTGVLALPAGLLGAPRQDHGELAAGRLTYYRISGPLVPALLVNQFVYLEAPGAATPLHAQGHRDHRQDRRAAHAARIHHAKNAVWGRHGAQPRAELRAQPADGPGVRLHHADRHRRHRQDADDAGFPA